jgi:hypothetical protein|tara:strand:- start:57 stop:269 length:213 start_codon:yes stop_codon:yes gene_type:complete
MKAVVTTILRQEIEVPEGTDRQSVLEFLAENQSFTDAFLGVSDITQRFRIVDISVVEEEITELSEEAYDE